MSGLKTPIEKTLSKVFTDDILEALKTKLIVMANKKDASREAAASIETKIPDDALVFVLVKDWCKHSQGACKILNNITQCWSKNRVVVLNVAHHELETVELYDIGKPKPDQSYIVEYFKENSFISNVKNEKGNIHSVPQVFVYSGGTWKYYGGEADIKKYTNQYCNANTNNQTTPTASAKCTLKW